jgi:hypothetical protein
MKTMTGLGPPVAEFPESEPIVGLINFKDRLFVATRWRMFELIDNKLVQMTFEILDEHGKLKECFDENRQP